MENKLNFSENVAFTPEAALARFGQFSRGFYSMPFYRKIWANIMPELKQMGYFTAPASTKFHLCISGGLLLHSVVVAAVALDLADRFAPGFCEHDIILAALLHDSGKCGLLSDGKLQPRYILNTEPFPSWPKQQKWWTPYIYTDSKPMFTVRDLSAFYASRWGLSYDIIQAILAHDGAYDDANKKYGMNSSPLSSLLTVADLFSVSVLETKTECLIKRWDI